MQTFRTIEKILEAIKSRSGREFKVLLLIGGESGSDVSAVSSYNILVGTPGRMKEVLFGVNDKAVSVSNVECLILDEADRLMEGNLKLRTKEILSKLPRQRRTGLFSATLSDVRIEELIKLGLRNPAKIFIKPQSQNENHFTLPAQLTNSVILFPNRLEKILYLISRLVDDVNSKTLVKVIVFFNTCASVDFYFKLFTHLCPKLQLWNLHGQREQTNRTRVFEEFSEVNSGVLLTTDVAARGVEFPSTNFIIQVDPPQHTEFFIHRIGRTARAGASGEAILLLEKSESGLLEFMATKGVPLQEKTYNLSDTGLEQKLRGVMLTDRDYFVKAQRAFLSFLRSYKEHELKYIFQLEGLEVFALARSFFLSIVPKIDETKLMRWENGNPGRRVLDETYWEQSRAIEFTDPNQRRQLDEKKQQMTEKHELIERKKKISRQIALNEQSSKKKRGFIDRKKAKERIQERENEEFEEENRLARKLKRGKISKGDYDREYRKLLRKYGNEAD